jgi:2-polyprenyl-3-methyl-5-hydroxy-6-metoxy-1,4-benzoquinol methylase
MSFPVPIANLAATPWPAEDLESVPRCPACGGTERRPWREGLVDGVFGCAPGIWRLVRCEACELAWLDPRPTRGSIMRAYARYYTHAAPDDARDRPRPVKTVLHQGYIRDRWGYALEPAWPHARYLLGARRRAALDLSVRHLAAPSQGRARLLDVGCGNGAFLSKMRTLGWEVHGLEPDRTAAAAARASGIDVVVGTLDDAPWPEASFDAVTTASVIEHVHDPVAMLAACRRLLLPEGRLSLVTPNADALGARRFGPHWRGLEAPRHLALFNRSSLRRLLVACGFTEGVFHPHYMGEWFWLTSGAIARGVAPDDAASLPRDVRRLLRREGRAADRRVAREPELAEELVVTARRSGSHA